MLTRAFDNSPSGTDGTIVLDYHDNCFEVKFFVAQGNTIDVLTTPEFAKNQKHMKTVVIRNSKNFGIGGL